MALSDIITGGLGIYDYQKGQDTARNVSDEMKQAATQGIGAVDKYLKPYAEAGQRGLAGYEQLLEDPSSVTQDPGYQFRLGQGMQSLERSAAAKSGLLSGGTLAGITQYSQDYASNEYDKALARRQTLSTQGLQAGQSAAPALADLYGNLGEASATRELLQMQNRQTAMQGVIGATGTGGILEGLFGGVGDTAGNWLKDKLGMGGDGSSAGPAGGGITGQGGPLSKLGQGGALPNLAAGAAGTMFGMDTFAGAEGAAGAVGGAAGGALGSMFGPAGTAIGSFLGAGAGGLVGDNPKGAAIGGILLGPMGALGGAAIQKFFGGDEDNVDADIYVGDSADAKDGVFAEGAFGSIGMLNKATRNITGKRVRTFQPLFDEIANIDNKLAEQLTPEEIEAVKDRAGELRGINTRDSAKAMISKSLDSREKVLKDILGDRYSLVSPVLDEARQVLQG